MGTLVELHRIRYPPFEPSRWNPEALPVAERRQIIGELDSIEEAHRRVGESGVTFSIGDESSWFVERSYEWNGQVLIPPNAFPHVDETPFASVITRQRQGWYLIPNPIHLRVRRFINAVVIVLLGSLMYLFISPLLLWLGLPVYGVEAVRWGLLDYPALAVVVVPLIFAPLAIRVVANLFELRRQTAFLNRAIQPPKIQFSHPPIADQPLAVKVTFPDWEGDWKHADVLWRVGALAPAREVLLELLDRRPDQQPPPGLSTELPHHWEVGLDDGTAGGEDAPMERQEVKGGLFLRPMRIMANGETKRWMEGKELSLQPPLPTWPGTTNTDLVRVHWECIVRIEREKGGPLLWVEPLRVGDPSSTMLSVNLPELHDGRSELDMIESTH